VTLSLLLLTSASVVPMAYSRKGYVDQVAQARIQYQRDLAALPADAPLWDRVRFLETPSEGQQIEILNAIIARPGRQAEAEIMLERGDFPLRYLGRMELRPTPVLCEKSRLLLRKQVEPLVLRPGTSKPFSEVFWPVTGAVESMTWLARNGCDISAEAASWQAMAEAYTDFNYDVYRLRDLALKKPQ